MAIRIKIGTDQLVGLPLNSDRVFVLEPCFSMVNLDEVCFEVLVDGGHFTFGNLVFSKEEVIDGERLGKFTIDPIDAALGFSGKKERRLLQ